MFPDTKSRETWRFEGKQNKLFPKGADIKCFVIHPEDDQSKQTNKQTNKKQTH